MKKSLFGFQVFRVPLGSANEKADSYCCVNVVEKQDSRLYHSKRAIMRKW